MSNGMSEVEEGSVRSMRPLCSGALPSVGSRLEVFGLLVANRDACEGCARAERYGDYVDY